jgi:hypothetical protein
MFGCDRKEPVDALAITFGVLLPRQVIRKTRMVVLCKTLGPASSLSIVCGSKVSACHISSSLMASAGM